MAEIDIEEAKSLARIKTYLRLEEKARIIQKVLNNLEVNRRGYTEDGKIDSRRIEEDRLRSINQKYGFRGTFHDDFRGFIPLDPIERARICSYENLGERERCIELLAKGGDPLAVQIRMFLRDAIYEARQGLIFPVEKLILRTMTEEEYFGYLRGKLPVSRYARQDFFLPYNPTLDQFGNILVSSRA